MLTLGDGVGSREGTEPQRSLHRRSLRICVLARIRACFQQHLHAPKLRASAGVAHQVEPRAHSVAMQCYTSVVSCLETSDRALRARGPLPFVAVAEGPQKARQNVALEAAAIPAQRFQQADRERESQRISGAARNIVQQLAQHAVRQRMSRITMKNPGVQLGELSVVTGCSASCHEQLE